ncbi:hypothetical protein L226DRAFT_540891 [Lentinus tigrinus ALCF2SS1-7]|uniref:Uncharacterized protein n=1 Tax=Lentinus tigrinus ALCF2SS1-6 TaxID=1328759 RepID=A0A5C2RRY1_9APHY|nr:hypothetical protein L227DRAFT_617390 [Lentinus tigrinus ALCF2SS1-6]RPD68193.1 hypothetical protein L226DRAFT_540891 [Lentinus tigrinus ALCF2SS1-7]
MDPSCAGSLATYVVVFDTLSHSQQLINIVITTTLFGISTSLAVASVYVLSGKGLKRWSAALQLTATLVLYTSTTTFTGAALRAAFATANQAQAAANAITNCDVQAVFNPIEIYSLGDRMICIQTATLVINIIVGDAIVWWRVYVLWPGIKARRVILGVSAVLLLATFILSVYDTCGACNTNSSLVLPEQGYGQLFSGSQTGAAAVGMSLATNAIATCFTAYRAWIHVRTLKVFDRKLSMTSAEEILILIAESGLVYTAIWVIVTVWQVGENNPNVFEYDTGNRTFWGITGYFVNGGLVPVIAIYPMFVIVMVALKRKRATSTYMFSTQISSQPPLSSPPPTIEGRSESGTSARSLVDA